MQINMKTLAEKVKVIEDNLEKLKKDEYDCLTDFYNCWKENIKFYLSFNVKVCRLGNDYFCSTTIYRKMNNV